jgi:hypothetical protein
MAKTAPLTDPFCQRLASDLADLDAALRLSLTVAERSDVLKLAAGLSVVMQMSAGKAPPTPELNAVLRARLGNGFSWFTCVQFLSGVRARDTFARQQVCLHDAVSPTILAFAEFALPKMGETLQALMADTQGARAARAARTLSP